jgi:hypothetical protein
MLDLIWAMWHEESPCRSSFRSLRNSNRGEIDPTFLANLASECVVRSQAMQIYKGAIARTSTAQPRKRHKTLHIISTMALFLRAAFLALLLASTQASRDVPLLQGMDGHIVF